MSAPTGRTVRLDRRLAELARLSRRHATAAIRAGRVTVGAVEERDPACAIPADAGVALDGILLAPPPRAALLHKPVGVHSTVRDDHGRPSLDTAAGELLALGLHPVGRLDADTSGLLLFSADGALTQHLLHPRRAMVRTYAATTDPPPTAALVERLAAGVATADGVFVGRVGAIDGDRVIVSVTEGKHRMVRRMLANVGHPVVTLHRLAYGPFVLGDLAEGAWRPASAGELAALAVSSGCGGSGR